MTLKQIIETVPGNTMLDVRKNNDRIIFRGEAKNNVFGFFSDEHLEKPVFTFFPLTDYGGTTCLIVYMDEEE